MIQSWQETSGSRSIVCLSPISNQDVAWTNEPNPRKQSQDWSIEPVLTRPHVNSFPNFDSDTGKLLGQWSISANDSILPESEREGKLPVETKINEGREYIYIWCPVWNKLNRRTFRKLEENSSADGIIFHLLVGWAATMLWRVTIRRDQVIEIIRACHTFQWSQAPSDDHDRDSTSGTGTRTPGSSDRLVYFSIERTKHTFSKGYWTWQTSPMTVYRR